MGRDSALGKNGTSKAVLSDSSQATAPQPANTSDSTFLAGHRLCLPVGSNAWKVSSQCNEWDADRSVPLPQLSTAATQGDAARLRRRFLEHMAHNKDAVVGAPDGAVVGAVGGGAPGVVRPTGTKGGNRLSNAVQKAALMGWARNLKEARAEEVVAHAARKANEAAALQLVAEEQIIKAQEQEQKRLMTLLLMSQHRFMQRTELSLAWENRKLSMAWEKWQFTAVEMARQQLMMQGALNRMVKRAMSMAWEKWQQVYGDAKVANRNGGGAINRMLNRKLSMAWEKWQFTAAEMARQQFLLAGALKRMIKRKMSAAWEKWQQVYADQKFAIRMGGGAIRRMLNRKLSMAWEKWQFTAVEMANCAYCVRRGLLHLCFVRAISTLSAWRSRCMVMQRLQTGMEEEPSIGC